MVKKKKAVHKVGQNFSKVLCVVKKTPRQKKTPHQNSIGKTWLSKDSGSWTQCCEDCTSPSWATYSVVGYCTTEHAGKVGESIKVVCSRCCGDYRVLENLEW